MALAQPARDRAHVPDQDGRRLDLTLRLLALMAIAFGGLDLPLGALLGRPGVIATGIVAIAGGTWVLTESVRRGPVGRIALIDRMTWVVIAICLFGATFQPEAAAAAAIAVLMPPVLAAPHVDRRRLGWLMLLAGAAGTACAIIGRVELTGTDTLLGLSLSLPGFIAGYLALLLFLWSVSTQLKGSADDLRSVVTMSSDLSKTLDPDLVGDRIAYHVARAVRASECGVNYLDRDGVRLDVHGYYPPERRAGVEQSYAVTEYPATLEVMRNQVPMIIDVDDPDADPAEVAFLREIDHKALAIVPLVAAGKTIGTIEFSSPLRNAFDQRRLRLATMLANEAAMTLENARLYHAIRHQAFHDGLTGLANRALFRDRVQHAMDRTSGRSGARHAVLFIDLDDFKTLNDRLGHARGDEVLVEAAQRVASSLRPGDTAARLGGDEFSILLEDVPDESVATAIADRVLAAFRDLIILDGAIATIRASIGIALTGPGETVDDLLRNADVAMYGAKARGRNRWALYGPELRRETAERGELDALLRAATARDELRLDFQPIVDLETGAIAGVEALVRWQPPDRPLLMPAEFIALAEETGTIIPIGRWVLREACAKARGWQLRLGLSELELSVNVSVRQFDDPEFISAVREALDDSGLPHSALTLEITESVLMSHTAETVARLDDLRALGVRLAIDDFGTGYSSLSYLERLPVDVLKIDRAFVDGLALDGAGLDRSVLARAIIDLGRALDLDVVAEGIERPEQASRLRELGCRLGQGFLFARPVAADALEVLLAQQAGLVPAGRRVPRAARLKRNASRRLRLVSGG